MHNPAIWIPQQSRTYGNPGDGLTKWGIWVCFPACCFVPIAAVICSTCRKDHTVCDNTHSIRNVALEEIVIRNLREAIAYVAQYEDDFIHEAAETDTRARDKALAQKKNTLAQAEKRIAELDIIFKRIYEDNISGKLTRDRS